MGKYLAKIGLEMHCEVSKTNTKCFSSARNSYDDTPNCNVSPVDVAFPGTLPVVNKEAVRMALMTSMILNCSQPEYFYFERKNYYYPDLPKGFQTTQETKPIPAGIYGMLEYECEGDAKTIRINNVHLEEDSASLDHLINTSNINYNRAGVPLIELVTEPDFHSASEAVAFLEYMISVYRYAGISDADTKKGQVRCDVNVSLMDSSLDENNPDNWGVKVEIKNVNSLGGVRDAINYEIQRQTEILDNNGEVLQETRRFDEETGTTIFMRSKVDSIDYKYFVEPNIPKFRVTQKWLEEIRASIPMLPLERKRKYINNYNLSEYDASILVKNKDVSDYFEKCLELGMDSKVAANWVAVNVVAYLNKEVIELKDFYLTPDLLNQIIEELTKGTISSKQAKEIFNKALEEKKEPKTFITKDNAQISDANVLEEIIINILNNNQEQVDAYHNGRSNLFDYFVGQVMKETRGKANPGIVKEILKGKLD